MSHLTKICHESTENLTGLHTQESIPPHLAANHLRHCAKDPSKLQVLFRYCLSLQRDLTTGRGFTKLIKEFRLKKKDIKVNKQTNKISAEADAPTTGDRDSGQRCGGAGPYSQLCPCCSQVCCLFNTVA